MYTIEIVYKYYLIEKVSFIVSHSFEGRFLGVFPFLFALVSEQTK